MSKTLIQCVGAGLVEIREPAITSFTSTNILQTALIEEVNERVNYILMRVRSGYRWGLARATMTTTLSVTTGTVAVVNGSTTVTSSGNNFTTTVAGMFIRVGSDLTSYEIDSVDTVSSPDTLVLKTAYVGTTNALATYVILSDIYTITDTTVDEIRLASYGQGWSWSSALMGRWGTDNLGIVDLTTIYDNAGGDLHRDKSGRPRLIAEVAPISTDNYKRFLLWPSPRDTQFVIDLWFSRKFSVLSTASTEIFGGDAPDVAYDAVFAGIRARACKWDENDSGAQYWEQKFAMMVNELVAREARAHMADNTMRVETFRRKYVKGARIESQVAFDTKPHAYL